MQPIGQGQKRKNSSNTTSTLTKTAPHKRITKARDPSPSPATNYKSSARPNYTDMHTLNPNPNHIKSLLFPTKLIRGIIVSRPNRFIMMVENCQTGIVERCHCPVTGDIGYLDFNKGGIPCLLSEPIKAGQRSTAFTVEAISLNTDSGSTSSTAAAAAAKNKKMHKQTPLQWIGINQVKANSYVQHFLAQGCLFQTSSTSSAGESSTVQCSVTTRSKLLKSLDTTPANVSVPGAACGNPLVTSEVTIKTSRIDFCVNRDSTTPHYVEVKSPMHNMSSESHACFDPVKRQRGTRAMIGKGGDVGGSRLVKHMHALAELAEGSVGSVGGEAHGAKCSILLFFMHDAAAFVPPSEANLGAPMGTKLAEIRAAVKRMKTSGVTSWQLNVMIDEVGVHFKDHFELEL